MVRTTITLLAMLLATPALAQSFNLECSGTLKRKSDFLDDQMPYHSTYRLNLDKGQWCEDACDLLYDIIEVQPTRIVLRKGDIPEGTVLEFVDRRTGEHYMSQTVTSRLRGAAKINLIWDGTCQKADFSGFPVFETKF